MKAKALWVLIAGAVIASMAVSACAPGRLVASNTAERTVKETVVVREVERAVTRVVEKELAVPLPSATPAPTAGPTPIYGGEALPNDEPFDAMFFEHLNHAVGHATCHVGHRTLSPFPGDSWPDALLHPGQVDLGTLEV